MFRICAITVLTGAIIAFCSPLEAQTYQRTYQQKTVKPANLDCRRDCSGNPQFARLVCRNVFGKVVSIIRTRNLCLQ